MSTHHVRLVSPAFLRTPALAVLCLSTALFDPTPASAAGYVFSTFHNDTHAGEKLTPLRSTDGLNFTLVSDTGFAGPSGYLRDPSIMKHADGSYYVAYTDPIGVGCCGKVDHFSVASTADLVHWTNVTIVPAGVPGVAHAWAPEWFVDDDLVGASRAPRVGKSPSRNSGSRYIRGRVARRRRNEPRRRERRFG